MFLTLCVLALLLIVECVDKSNNRLQDLKAVEKLQPLVDGANVFFWRPQKVGSSTLLSILMSYGYRYNFLPKRKSSSNAYCRLFAKCAIAHKQFSSNASYSYLESYVMQKVPGTPASNQHLSQKDLDAEKLSNKVGYKISLSHEICNLNAQVVADTLACSYTKLTDKSSSRPPETPVKELFVLRDPLSRAISVYYFWGELFKMKHTMKRTHQEKLEKKAKGKGKAEQDARRQLAWSGELKLGESSFAKPVVVHGQRFQYHGQESTAPGPGIAMAYANHTIYRPGMPGPSYTWSLFADNLPDALRIVQSDRICTVVLERLHESLVVAAHYLHWSLADVVVTKHRKALSSHPKHTSWPAPAVKVLRNQLNAPEHGEYMMYNASVAKLDQRIAVLQKAGVDVPAEVEKLKALQKRVSEVAEVSVCVLPLHI
jgi:hypothetical protein